MLAIKKANFILTLFYLLIFGGIICYYHYSPSFQEQLNIGIHNAQVMTQSIFRQLTGQELTAPANNQDTDQTEGNDARWQQPAATIYVDLDNTVLKNATETAIAQWNNAKVFTFKPVANRKDANIVVTAVNDPNSGAAGLTNTSMNALTGYYLHADVKLNTAYLLNPAFGYSQKRIINTVEHELGHAIGLQHTDKVSVMQPAGSYYPIQPLDIQDVKKLYSRTPQPVTDQESTSQPQSN